MSVPFQIQAFLDELGDRYVNRVLHMSPLPFRVRTHIKNHMVRVLGSHMSKTGGAELGEVIQRLPHGGQSDTPSGRKPMMRSYPARWNRWVASRASSSVSQIMTMSRAEGMTMPSQFTELVPCPTLRAPGMNAAPNAVAARMSSSATPSRIAFSTSSTVYLRMWHASRSRPGPRWLVWAMVWKLAGRV